MSDSSIGLTPGEVASYYKARVPLLRQSDSREWRGPCPVHQGHDDNFNVESATGKWFCHSQCGRGGDIAELEAQALRGELHGSKGRSTPAAGRICPIPSKGEAPAGGWREVERYSYEDREGRPVFEVVRYQKPNGEKAFRQCRSGGRCETVWLSGASTGGGGAEART